MSKVLKGQQIELKNKRELARRPWTWDKTVEMYVCYETDNPVLPYEVHCATTNQLLCAFRSRIEALDYLYTIGKPLNDQACLVDKMGKNLPSTSSVIQIRVL
jgi:hypothetical protein